jgi:hypothetical protein
VLISNIVCSNSDSRFGSIISGIPGHAIEDIKISDVYIQHQGGATSQTAALQPADLEKSYPEPKMFGPMPSQGFFIRHVKNIEMSGVEISSLVEDARPAFVLDDVQGVRFFRVRGPNTQGVPRFVLNNVEDFDVYLSKPVPDTQLDKVATKNL